MSPLVTVVIPFLDVEPYIAEAVESVLAQTYDPWELVLVDDGSRDGSRAIADRYSAAHPGRILCVEHEGRANRGASASRNLGRRCGRGTYIAFLDSDDRWVPEKLQRQMEIIRANPDIGLLVGATRYWHGWPGSGRSPDEDRVLQVGGPNDRPIDPPGLATVLYPLGSGAAPSMNTVLVRADAFDRIGGFEESFRTAFDDQALLLKLYLSAPVYISSQVWDDYRQFRPGSITQQELRGEERRRHKHAFLTWAAGYLDANGFAGSPARAQAAQALLAPEFERFRAPLLWRAKRLARPIRHLGRKLLGTAS
jgi:glycosyltransferase involved in cell wall biosynthesis